MNRLHSRSMQRAASVATIAAAIGLAACDRETPPEPSVSEAITQDLGRAATEARDAVADATITASVHANLARDGELGPLKIAVDTVDGVVVLRGTAPSPAVAERAVRIAQGTDGVRSVESQLTVQAG